MNSPRGFLAKAVAETPLLLRDAKKFPTGTKKGIPNPEDYGFDTTSYIYQSSPFTRQVVRAIKK